MTFLYELPLQQEANVKAVIAAALVLVAGQRRGQTALANA